MFLIVSVSCVCLAAFCFGADHIIFGWESQWMKLAHGQALRAVSDSLVHGVLGGWCWVNVILLGKEEWTGVRMAQVILCCLMAAGMDVDHMIEARSLSIKDALNLSRRPFAHNSTLIPICAALLSIMVYAFPFLKQNSVLQDLPALFITSTLSHHLRDADRRGLWLAPLGSTPAIPHKLYVLLVISLPLCIIAAPMVARRIYQLMSLVHRTKSYDVSYA